MTNTLIPKIPPPPARPWVVYGGHRAHDPRIFVGPLAECIRRAGPTDRVVPA